ncbi:MAG: hypothetical protein TRG1_1274 [Flavobacteriaceae bacterium FS1-H7996/R]|nr:MAG: hypothetical protein TRG1_1274 [Flavobacteriaceae bacterium FS1-H7996/R]
MDIVSFRYICKLLIRKYHLLDYIKSKSVFNLEAAKELINEHQYYAPSVHCSYYGCFQHIMSKLNSIGITYEIMDNDIANSKQDGVPTLYSNKYPIDLIIKEISKKSDLIYTKNVRDKIKKLKLFRVMSDYHNDQINEPKSTEALRLSHEIINLINKKI